MYIRFGLILLLSIAFLNICYSLPIYGKKHNTHTAVNSGGLKAVDHSSSVQNHQVAEDIRTKRKAKHHHKGGHHYGRPHHGGHYKGHGYHRG